MKRGKLKASLIAQNDGAECSYEDRVPEAQKVQNHEIKKRKLTYQDVEKEREETAEVEKLLSSKRKLKASHTAHKDDADCGFEDRTPEALQTWKHENKKRKGTYQDIEKGREETEKLGKMLSNKLAKCDLESGSVTPVEKSNEAEKKEKIVTNTNEGTKKDELNKEGTNWIQKASWTSLVGETGRLDFSLNSMLTNSGITLPELNGNPSAVTGHQPSSQIRESKVLNSQLAGAYISDSLGCDSKPNGSVTDTRKWKISTSYVSNSLKMDTKLENGMNLPDAKQGLQDISQCHTDGSTFVRSENYEEEWQEAKRAVKEILKRSRKDALKSVKMFHTRFKI
ncbi:hypothetical protein KP509_05G091600 [Ceratopteris richardii]|uniref:Uncharacterized protein n=1 Tax=Ceratopteris richardii TaxID=49495 RepID=A0A8T2USW4_CERRI|nr:hypothetical protein KP509_05G091600 [Ceratopteris richardii]KAH7437838.1 hypothetical protein KP509_05G091600 [Ceratopteris richardii]